MTADTLQTFNVNRPEVKVTAWQRISKFVTSH